MKKTALITASLLGLPLLASAQTLAPVQTLIVSIGNIIALLIPISIGVAMLVFFYGLIIYIKNAEKGAGQKIMINGILALFVMVSIWGIVALAQNALGVTGNQNVPAPHFPTN